MTKFVRGLLEEWRRLELPLRNARIIVAVSGGADSTALLLALSELVTTKKFAVELLAAHMDHGLRGKVSREDAAWVARLAGQLNHEAVVTRVNIKQRATNAGDNLEQAARRARYDFLAKAARNAGAQMVLTGHTMDDQAETMMLNLLRGSGVEGLAGIEPVRVLDDREGTLLVRPLLNWARHADTEKYCAERGIVPRNDEMNLDEKYSRVRVRRRLLPLMETFNGRVVEALSRTARLLREDSSALSAAADHLLEQATEKTTAENRTNLLNLDAKNKMPLLCVEVLATAAPALRRRALRRWIAQGRGDVRRLELVHLLAVEKLLSGARGGRVIELPGGTRVSRKRGVLEFHAVSPGPTKRAGQGERAVSAALQPDSPAR
jgi:tRNA(Ile)-lysidine synthase